MESPRKFNDCYFYYYSTCTKGDNCVFRHEPSALGCETMCTAWQQGKCLDKCCKLRHMELRKNRKQIPCYWENQPGGCRKKHCPFMHKNPDARTDGIAPSQPAPVGQAPIPEVEAGIMNPTVPVPAVPAPAPAPVPLLWQQQRQQVVLDSAILGVLPTNELLPRRVVTHTHPHAHTHAHAHAHPHAHPHEPYPLPVDPLVVNFEEESDNESAPSSTPTKAPPPPPARPAHPAHPGHPSHRTDARRELALLARIQAEAAALYAYDALPPPALPPPPPVLDGDTRNSLDFKVLSLDEIRARKKVSETVIHTTPITLNLNRKRKLSTHETLTTSGNKIIKMVRSNSIVYKKIDKNAQAQTNHGKMDQKRAEDSSRKRTLSEQSDTIYDIHEDELVDNCYEFKRIKIAEIPKPRLVRNRSATKSVSESKDDGSVAKNDQDSDTEVQFVSIELESDVFKAAVDIIDLETTKLGDPVDIVDLCEEQDEVTASNLDLELDLVKNVPDVVASCQKNNKNDKELLNDIDAFLNEEL